MLHKITLESLTPPLVTAIARRVRFVARARLTSFRSWWAGCEERKSLPQELVTMVDAFTESEDYRAVSRYWHQLNRQNLEQLSGGGIKNFRQTVARNYFTWGGSLDAEIARKLVQVAGQSGASFPVRQILKKHDLFSLDESIDYNLLTLCLYALLQERGGAHMLGRLRDNDFGSPPSLDLDGISITQDKINSLIEWQSFNELIDMSTVSRMLEVGAGSGRTAAGILSLNPDTKYVIADVPPALYLSQTYLSAAFPEKRIFRFRPFRDFSEVSEEFMQADIAFLLPGQLRMLSPDSFDLFIAVDCLHEMTAEQNAYLFSQADRLARNFYFKCWHKTVVPLDNQSHEKDGYPIPAHWQQRYMRDCLFPSNFFEAGYRTR